MKLTGKPIYPADLAPTAKVTAAETAIAKLDTDYKAADKTLGDKNTTQDTAIAAVKTTADKAATDITALTTTVTNNKAAADAGISSAIAEWDKDRPYKVSNKVMRNDAWFKCVIDNTNIDPLTDRSGSWGIFTPGSENDRFEYRDPTSSDVLPEGVRWNNLSWGAATPLRFVSMGGGAWTYLNQITLSRVRFYVSGINSTYQSNLNSIKFFKKDGTQMPNSSWVWGNRSGLGGQPAGSNYTGQSMGAGYNASGWAELQPNSSFDLSESITKVTGSTGYANCTKVEFYYSNGGFKTFTPGGGNLATCDPAIQARFGDSVASVLGETLTVAKLTDGTNLDPGRITGSSFVQAYNVLSNALLRRTDDLEARMALLLTQQTNIQLSTHDAAFTNTRGEFVNLIPGGGVFTYGNSRNGGDNSFTFPKNVYEGVVSYYVDAADVQIPMSSTTLSITPEMTAITVSAIPVSTEAIAYVVEFFTATERNSYRIPLV